MFYENNTRKISKRDVLQTQPFNVHAVNISKGMLSKLDKRAAETGSYADAMHSLMMIINEIERKLNDAFVDKPNAILDVRRNVRKERYAIYVYDESRDSIEQLLVYSNNRFLTYNFMQHELESRNIDEYFVLDMMEHVTYRNAVSVELSTITQEMT